MALWMVRAGKYGEHEARFLDTKRVYATWDGLNRDLSKVKDTSDCAQFCRRSILITHEVRSSTTPVGSGRS